MYEHLNSREEYQEFYEKQGEGTTYGNQHITEKWERMIPQVKYFKGNIFEAGTQTGGVTKILSEHGDTVTTCEISSTYLARAKEFLKDRDNINFRYGFVEDILSDYVSAFDVVVLNEILEHVADDRLVVDLAFNALKHNGVLAFSMPLENIFPDTLGEHVREYDVSDVLELLDPYAHNIWIEPVEGPFWITGVAWKRESPKRTFMQNINLWEKNE